MQWFGHFADFGFVLIVMHVRGIANARDMVMIPDPDHKIPVIDLQDGQSYVVSSSNRFCYENSIKPTWKQTWTRIQVSPSEQS